ncbi:pitrilysin family protein [Kitasatospora sp. YST-16]|uniref:M16 family metallopeptidase n=1 Tax=unclassified Kitasatospora TaxID=2633591 RepID=UPI001E49B26A|nr:MULTISPECIES: pitrilysin family protein [unclassified Kitasatospora]WAL74091.1 pitrilysin family protein [Kitasatospora sp. YST-16]WNW40161.1 pitrilysin family protein [Streptomyces sp. Li-HN-5-13]
MAQASAAKQRPGTTRTLLKGSEGGAGTVRRTVLPGGLRVVTETLPTVRSATFGIWVGVGSRDETPVLNGATHYLEHLLFKGTARRDALEISAALDAVGGEMNAFTAKENTCYYARVLDTDLPLAIDVVCDMLTGSLIRPEDVESERGVILEEMAMAEDDPGDVVHDLFAKVLFGDGPLGRPILGTQETVTALTRDQIAGFYQRRYKPENLVVAAAGNLDHAKVVKLVERAFAPVLAKSKGHPAEVRRGVKAVRTAGRAAVLNRPTEQAHLVLGVPGVPRHDERRWALGVLNAALGGGMSSRLFQEVREKRGLAYSVYSYSSSYADTGLFGIYAGCQPKRVEEVLKICRTELARVVEEGITEEELRRAIGQISGSTVLGMEDTGSLMNRIGKAELSYGHHLSVDEMLGKIAAVTLDDVHAVARDVLGAHRPSLALIGPINDRRAAKLADLLV